jgi:hypothetical protein
MPDCSIFLLAIICRDHYVLNFHGIVSRYEVYLAINIRFYYVKQLRN